MIRITNTAVYGWEAAIRGMRNPMNSWDKSDSRFCGELDSDCEDCGYGKQNSLPCPNHDTLVVGNNDYSLMKRLGNAGPDHGKFLRMITVTMDVYAPLYWWKEADTYKVGTVANSCSTMHKIHSKEFTLDDFSHEHLYDGNYYDEPVNSYELLLHTIKTLNYYREEFIETKDKCYWWQLIQLLPSSYNQLRTVQLNYQVLKSMYHARKNHKLDEWRDFCAWIKTLPYSELITGEAI